MQREEKGILGILSGPMDCFFSSDFSLAGLFFLGEGEGGGGGGLIKFDSQQKTSPKQKHPKENYRTEGHL